MEINISQISKILSTPIALRGPKMISVLMNLTKEFSFFKSLIQELGEKMHYRICEFLNLDTGQEDTVIFNQGDVGDKFYILLHGTVKLVISKPGKEEAVSEVVQLGPGQSFGELSLIKNQPRTGSVICLETCFFMTLSKENYLRLLGKSFAKALEEKIEFLQSLSLFCKWTKKSLEKLTYFFTVKHFKRDEVIYCKGDKSFGAFAIFKGQVELTTVNKGTQNLPKSLKIAMISEKDFFGDEEVLLNVDRKYTAKCCSKFAVIYFITKEDFLGKVDKESLRSLLRTNDLRNTLRESRLKNIKGLNESQEVSSEPKKPKKNEQICLKRKISKTPGRNISLSPGVMKNIQKRSLANLLSPTVDVIKNHSIYSRPKSVNIFVNVNGFQPRNQLPSGIFRRIQERIKVGLMI